MTRSRTAFCRTLVSAVSLVVALSAAGVAADEAADEPRSRPNIVFILTDDQRYDSLGCTGNRVAQTPHIDRLAREGALATNFFVATPLCSPSRASFLTGLYAHRHRIINNDKLGLEGVSHTLLTFPRVLRENGYETAFIGKWHMGFDDSRRPGFDHWISFKGQGLFIDPVVNIDGHVRQCDGYMTDLLNEWAVDFIDRERSKPFALYLSHKAVHRPYLPAERHESLFPDFRFTPPKLEPSDLAGKPILTRPLEARVDNLRLEGVQPEPAESRRGHANTPQAIMVDQMRCLASVDDGVGLVLEALERQGVLDDTLVIFTSDNGYLMGEHAQFDNKRTAYEDSVRVPLVMRYPRLAKAGTRIDALLSSVDIAPTILDLAQVEQYERMHGRSFAALLSNHDAPWRSSVLCEYFVEKVGLRFPDWQSVRTARWKYIHYPDFEGMDELYDLDNDPREVRNVINEPSSREALAELRGELVRLLQETK